MRKSRFTETLIIGIIKKQKAGMPTAEVCQRIGLSPASFLKFKAKYGRMNVSDTHRLKSLENEIVHLKRLLTDTMLSNIVLKNLLGRN
jgi:putative transposase